MNQRGKGGEDFLAGLDQFLASSRNRWLLLGGLAAATACLLIVLAVLLLRAYLPQAAHNPAATLAPGAPVVDNQPGAVATTAPQPTTPVCTDPWLVVGQTRYALQPVATNPDGSTFPISTDAADQTMYLYKPTEEQYVFVLGPSAAGLALVQSVQPNDLATTGGTNCPVVSFYLSLPEPAVYSPSLWDATPEGMLLYLQNAPGAPGLLVRGSVVPEVILVTSTPDPAGPGVEAEIGLEGVSSTLLGKLRVQVTVYNYGAAAFTLNPADVSVIPTGGVPLALEDASPNLPFTVQPGETKEFSFTFAKPQVPTAVFKILSVEYDIEGY